MAICSIDVGFKSNGCNFILITYNLNGNNKQCYEWLKVDKQLYGTKWDTLYSYQNSPIIITTIPKAITTIKGYLHHPSLEENINQATTHYTGTIYVLI